MQSTEPVQSTEPDRPREMDRPPAVARCSWLAWLWGGRGDASRSIVVPAETTAAEWIAQPRPLVIAHRGDSQACPENTCAAFARALDGAADLVELDYQHTLDGVPVVIHDATLDRTTDALRHWGGRDLAVAARTAAELAGLDAGRWHHRRYRGARLPTLEQALRLIAPRGITLVERKAGDAATCYQVLARAGALNRVVVQAFDHRFLAELRRLAPELPLAALGTGELSEQRLDDLQALGLPVVSWDHRNVDRGRIAAAARRGLRVWTYTVDDLRRAEQLIAAGVGGIITNAPGRVRALMQRIRAGAPPGGPAAR